MLHIQFILGFLIAAFIGVMAQFFLFRKWKRVKEGLIRKHDDFVHVVENANDFIYYCQVYPNVQYKYISPSAENIFGKGSIQRAFDNPDIPFIDIHPDDYEILIKKVNGELDFSQSIIQRWKDKDGKYRWFEEYATPVYENGILIALQGVLRTIDDRITLQQELQYRINHDSLTGLFNREYFEMMFIKFNEQINTSVAIIVCDLDELKIINDHYGHKAGDLLIKTTASILKKFSSESVVCSRLGGDEFALLKFHTNLEDAESLVRTIDNKINSYRIEPLSRTIKMSIGFAYSNISVNNMEKLFIEADKKMYISKNQKKLLVTT